MNEPEFELYNFKEAAAMFPSKAITASSLKTEYEKGNLEVIKIAGRNYVTRTALTAMIAGKCKEAKTCTTTEKTMTSSYTVQTLNMEQKPKQALNDISGISSGMKTAGSASVQQVKAVSKMLKSSCKKSGSQAE